MRNKAKTHILKIKDVYWNSVKNGSKKAELRKNDRDFTIGDYIHFVDCDGCELGGSYNLFVITDITPADAVIPDAGEYVMLSITSLEVQFDNILNRRGL